VLESVEVRALCGPNKFFHTKPIKFGISQNQTHPSDCQTEKRDLSEHVPLLQSLMVVFFTSLHAMLGIVLSDVRLAYNCCNAPIPWSSCHLCADINANGGWELFSYGISRLGFDVPKCFHFPIIPLAVNCGISSRDEISRIDLLPRWHPVRVPPPHKCL